MSQITKRKHVMKQLQADEFELPKENQKIVKIINSKGNNLHEVISPDEETYLISMPTKFRKNIWVKRGQYVLVEPISEGDKVKGEIIRILSKEAIKHYKENNIWPKKFDDPTKVEDKLEEDIFVNPNRVNSAAYGSSDTSSCSSDSDSDD